MVCPVSIVGQWLEEARSKLGGSLTLYQYHGQARERDAATIATAYDVVVTTYQTLGSDWRAYTKKAGGDDGRFPPLGQIRWHRIILDVRCISASPVFALQVNVKTVLGMRQALLGLAAGEPHSQSRKRSAIAGMLCPGVASPVSPEITAACMSLPLVPLQHASPAVPH